MWQAEAQVVLQPATRIPLQTSHTETPTHVKIRTHNQCGDTIEKSQAPDDGCVNVRNMLNIEGFSLPHGYHPNPATPKLQHTSKQEHTNNVVIQ